MIDALYKTLTQGGWVLQAIIAVSVSAWALIAWEWMRLRDHTRVRWPQIARAIDELAHHHHSQFQPADQPHANLVAQLLAGELWRGQHDRASFDAQIMPLLRSQAAMLHAPLQVVAVLAALMPLLGLLGTVMGMTHTFTGIASHHQLQTDAMAGGISQALVTTQAGLVAAIPVVLIHSYLLANVRRYVDTSAVMIKRIEAIVCRD